MELKLKDQELSFTRERLEEVKHASTVMQKEKEQLLEILQRQSLLLEAPLATFK